MLALTLTAASCDSPPAAPPPLLLPDLPALVIQANGTRLHTAPDEASAVAQLVQIGQTVTVSEWNDEWLKVEGGWVRSDEVGLEAPTVDGLLAKHDTLAAGDPLRQVFLERAATMQAGNLGVLKRQLAAAEHKKDKAAAQKLRTSVEAARNELPTGRLAVITDTVPARRQPTDASPIATTLHAGHVVVLGETQGAWTGVRYEDETMWVKPGAYIGLDVALFQDQEVGTDPSNVITEMTGPGAALLAESFTERASQNPSVHARRQLARVLIGYVCNDITEPDKDQDDPPGFIDVSTLWRWIQIDDDVHTAVAAHEAMLECLKSHPRLKRSSSFREVLADVVLDPDNRPLEKKVLRPIVQNTKLDPADRARLLAALK